METLQIELKISEQVKSWISQEEAKAWSKKLEDIEYDMLFGIGSAKRRDLRIDVAVLKNINLIEKEEAETLNKMIESSLGEDVQFAETLIENFKNNVSNIQSREPQV